MVKWVLFGLLTIALLIVNAVFMNMANTESASLEKLRTEILRGDELGQQLLGNILLRNETWRHISSLVFKFDRYDVALPNDLFKETDQIVLFEYNDQSSLIRFWLPPERKAMISYLEIAGADPTKLKSSKAGELKHTTVAGAGWHSITRNRIDRDGKCIGVTLSVDDEVVSSLEFKSMHNSGSSHSGISAAPQIIKLESERNSDFYFRSSLWQLHFVDEGDANQAYGFEIDNIELLEDE